MITNQPIKIRQDDTESAILEEARERASIAQFGWRKTFDSAKNDEAFIAGKQWGERVRREREQDGRPVLTMNQLQQYVSRISGAQKKQVQEIKISPVESNSVKESSITTIGESDVALSKVLEGVIRNIQSTSNATAQYKTAFRHSLTGIGWLRVLTDYARNDSFDQDIKIEAIRDRFSVLIDPHAKESDYSDAEYCFIHESISHDEFKARYPAGSIGSLSNENEGFFWGDSKTITVSEYFRREPVTRTLCLLSSGETEYLEELKPVLDELAAQGITVVRQRKVKTYKIVWCKITSSSILEKEREFKTNTIPVVPVVGREVLINDERSYQGAITHALDPQQMLNYWQSAAAERISLAPKAPYIAEVSAIEGFEAIWKTANIKNYSVLPYNKGSQPPRREMPPSMPVAEANMASMMGESIQATIGMYDASLGKAGNETSGVAIQSRQNESDTGTFEFIDSMSNAMRRVGILLVDLIPSVYDTQRILRIKSPDGSGDFVEINKVVVDEETGQEVVINDLSMGKYDVVVTTGASYATKRMETADSILKFAQAVPQAVAVSSDLIAENMDFNNSDAIAERLKKTLPANILSKEEQEEIEADSPPPSPSPEQIAAESKAKEQEVQLQLKEMDLQGQALDNEFNLKQEEIKLQVSQLNLETKKIESGMKLEGQLNQERDRKRKDRSEMVKGIAGQMK